MFKIKRIEKRVNTRKLMYSMLAFVLVGITTMTIAYATLSTTLKITGSAEFQDASWNLLLEELNEILNSDLNKEKHPEGCFFSGQE